MISSRRTERHPEKPWMAPPRAKEARLYTLPDLALLLGTVVVCLFLLESEGLLTWAQRMEVSAAQASAVSVLRTANELLKSLGFTRPREVTMQLGDRLAQWLGAEADPLLAGGWRDSKPLSYSAPEPVRIDEKEGLEPSDEASPSEPTTETEATGAAGWRAGAPRMAGAPRPASRSSLPRGPNPAP